MKYIKSKDTIILFDELNNHGWMAALVGGIQDVQSAGFAKMFPTNNNQIKISMGGRSNTLKIDSNPVDRELVAQQIHFTKENPANFVVFDTTLILYPANSVIDVTALIKETYDDTPVVSGSVHFTTVESDSWFHESGWKSVPHFSNLVGDVTDLTLHTIDFNVRAD